MTKNTKKNVILTNDFNIDDYRKTFAEEEGITEEETYERIHEIKLYEYIDSQINEDLANFYQEVINYEAKHEGKWYVVLASLQSWNGYYAGGNVIKGMMTVVSRCMEDYYELYHEGKKLFMSATHHDGTNSFKIKELTKEGERYFENHEHDMSDRELHAKLFNDSHLSRHPTIFKEIYGF